MSTPSPRCIALAALASGCLLDPSPLGMLPDTDTTHSTSSDTSTSTSAPPTTSPTTSPTTNGSSGPDESDAGSGTSADTEAPPSTPWGLYCEYINTHGGACDPNVDSFPDLAYPGAGFIVHEWGTDTVVVASDGVAQRGLQHEEEGLPDFVHARVPAGALEGSVSVHVKMETPVTYFYSEVARTVKVAVSFPDGVFSEWFPPVARFEPFIAAPGAVPKLPDYGDPVLDPGFAFATQACREQYSVIAAGLLDWGEVAVLARGAREPLLAAPIDQFTWGHAREVDANLLRVVDVPGAASPQHERFLFYRGLGNFPLPLTLTAEEGGLFAVDNGSGTPVGRIFILHVDAERGAFVERSEGLAPGQMLADVVPSLAPAPPLELFADALAERVTEALDQTGLYHDEALAMVATWKRQWFRSPGLRVLYLVPQAWTDASIPLAVEPAPDASLRVMMIRGELLTPELELADVAAAGLLASIDTEQEGRAHFLALGRFAEPRLRRASQLLGEPAYLAAFLAEVVHADARVAAAE